MEELDIKTINVTLRGKPISCQVKEKDYGDYIVFDVFSGGHYLVTLSKQGAVLFNKEELTDKQEIMDPVQLNDLINALKEKIEMGEIN